MSDLALTELSASAIAQRVQDGVLSASDVARAYLRRIDELDNTIHAFQAVRHLEVLTEASNLDSRADRGLLPLAGVPVAVSDNLAIAGLPTRKGSSATSDAPAASDDEAVRRLRAAGALILGSTQLAELSAWPFTEPRAFPAPQNPWKRGRTPGGGAGGAAAALAGGMAALAVACDGDGSIRVPASCCGLFGVKPTPGLLPLPDGRSEHWYGMTAVGPIARTVADAALAFDVLSGSTFLREPGTPPEPLRIAYDPIHPVSTAKMAIETRIAARDAAKALQEQGHTIIAARPPYPADLPARFSRRWLAGVAGDAAGMHHGELERRTRRMARRGRRFARKASPISNDGFGKTMHEWFGDYDALLTPTLTRTAVPIGIWPSGVLRTMIGVGNWRYTTAWNVAGLPAASLPYGLDPDGLPIGLQLVAPAGAEGTIFALAAQLEQLHPWPLVASEPAR